MDTVEKIQELRKEMLKAGISAYIIVTDDFHGSEYVGDYFKEREYMSGFTGSAGTLIVLDEKAALWTDGRYFLQAEAQLNGSGIELMKSGQPGVPTMLKYLQDHLHDGDTVGFDGRTISCNFGKMLRKELKNIVFKSDVDLVDIIWKERPPISTEKVWRLEEKYTGESMKSKLGRVREAMFEEGADALVVTALDEIAWLLNLRGNDVRCTPVFLAFMLIMPDNAILCVHEEILNDEIRTELLSAGVIIADYDGIYEFMAQVPQNLKIWIDGTTANMEISGNLPKSAVVIDKKSPIALMKAIKTKCEYENMRIAHVKDGVAFTRFMYWLKSNVGKINITEMSASSKLESIRCEGEGYIGPSFDYIIAYGSHGAIVHYEPTNETDIELKPEGLCLADTGGHYVYGTTDITRTIALGNVTDEEKRAFTLVLKGNLNLGAAKFLHGCCGENLDYIARKPLWENNMDYNHGTGHGVGYLLSVHEGPQAVRWNINLKKDHYVLEEGMIFSNEPGFYATGKFGIRHENLMLVRKGEANEYGQFMYLEPLTAVPFDLDAVDISLMTDEEIKYLNEYHAFVYNTVSPYMNGDELEWLKKATRKL